MTQKLYNHQKQDIPFYLKNFADGKGVINASDPGTGKTRTVIETIRATKNRGKTLVIAPKTILAAAWGNDIEKFAPELRYVIAYASNRRKAFETDADIYITNHDATTWLKENRHLLQGFYRMDIDESTAFKHRTAARSKAAAFISKVIPIRNIMSGTFTPNSVLDAWHQAFLVDHGERLSNSYFKFRSQTCDAIPGYQGHATWADKPEAPQLVAALLKDIMIRHKFEDCISIPPNNKYTMNFVMNSVHAHYYHEIEDTSMLEVGGGTITAFNASALHTKLLQAASGAVYTEDDQYEILDTARAELIIDLILEREQCLVAFNWRHQRDQLVKLAKKANITYGILDGTTNDKARKQLVEDFQNRKIKVAFIHPQSGAHGLTLTAGTTTIWASPTANAEHFEQFNRRIYRAGQTRKTETILICAKGTKDEHYYNLLNRKMTNMTNMLMLSELFSKSNFKEST